MVSKQNPWFQPAPAYRLPVKGAVSQVTGAVRPKVTCSMTHVTPYLGLVKQLTVQDQWVKAAWVHFYELN